MESMDTVSLQAVTLADGSTAYIQHDSKASFSDGQIMDGQVIQLEDGSAAYVQHVSMPKAGKTRIPAVYQERENLNIVPQYMSLDSTLDVRPPLLLRVCCMMGSNHLFVFYLCVTMLSYMTSSLHTDVRKSTKVENNQFLLVK